MKGMNLFRLFSALTLGTLVASTLYAQTQLAYWDFNESNPLDGTAMLAPEAGVFASVATISINGATFSFNNSGSGFRGSPQDPNNAGHPNPPNWGLQTTNYPAQGTANRTAGIVVSVPTTGYKDIVVKFDVRWSNTASKFIRFQYTTDGGANWIDGVLLEGRRGDRWHGDTSANGGYDGLVVVDFTGNTAVENNPDFAFRVVTEFDPATNQYTAANFPNNPNANYSSQGTLRYDLIEILGTEIGGGIEGDVNGDGCVDDADLLAVLFAFGSDTGGPEDVNSDGIVDDADLLIVLFNFGTGC
ncbi:MAG: hypothetical protein SNJ72_09630 [Fimbriimonadales bacterium]